VQADVRFTSLAAGSAFTCGVTTSGDAYCWGTNSEGQTGSGAGADAPLPGFISSPAKFVLVTAGKEHACGLTTEHEAFCWGSNAQGQLGAVAKQRSFVPVAVVFPP
jgi:alpha-tubulin suppressor-like RCC1 family protein